MFSAWPSVRAPRKPLAADVVVRTVPYTLDSALHQTLKVQRVGANARASMKATAPLAPRAIAPLFHCLHAHFDSLYGYDQAGKQKSLTTDLGSTSYTFRDKPFKDLIRHYAWLTPDSVAVELYCHSANYPNTYDVYDGGAHDFLFDSTSCTYKPVPSGTPGSIEFPHEIQWEDLAIWIVYTDLKWKQRAKYGP